MTENRWKKSTKRSIAWAIGVLVVAGIAAATTINSQFFVGKSQILHYWDRNLDTIVPLSAGLIPTIDGSGNPVGQALDTKINLLISTGPTAATHPWASARYTWSSAIGTVSKTDLVGGVLPATVGFAAGVPQYLLYNTDFISGDDLGQGLAVGPYLYDGAQWDMARSMEGAGYQSTGVGIAAVGLYVSDGTNIFQFRDADWQGDGTSAEGNWSAIMFGWNGAAYDRVRTGPGPYGNGELMVFYKSQYRNISTNDNTTVIDRTGILHAININTLGSGSTITVYDNAYGAGGVKIATIDSSIGPGTRTFDLHFTSGLTIATAGTTAADITVTYK